MSNLFLLKNCARWTLAFAIGFVLWLFWIQTVSAANFSVTPSSGSYTVGSTFEVSLVVDTQGREINAVQVKLAFPPDKLQLVSPSTGNSIISLYTTPPNYDNSKGEITIAGGIPRGINAGSGLITKLTFRVKSVGTASLRFIGNSQILLNDGKGTDVLDDTFGAVYKLALPPQQGPIVVSDTHSDEELWYKNSNVDLRWDIGLPPAVSYSYSISDNPTDVPDDISDTTDQQVGYRNLAEGNKFFHIKAFRDGKWGGVSHYNIKIDKSAPALFEIDIAPHQRTFITKPFIQFNSSDALSGLDRFEIKIIALKISGRSKATATEEQLFVDATSPYQTQDLLHGSYNVIVRAYDKAGNIREVAQELEITDSVFWFLSEDGIALPFGREVNWGVVISVSLIFILLLLASIFFLRKWYKSSHHKISSKHLPDTIANQLEELKKYRSKYGKIVTIFLVFFIAGFINIGLVNAQEVAPPVIGSYSTNIKDDELFYVSGRTTEPNSAVIIHLQSLVDGGAFDFTIDSDKRGDWTYRHNGFLSGGKYIIWAHTKMGDQLSAPSPQVEMNVRPVAINWGNSRITYQSIYIAVIVVLAILSLALIIFIVIYGLLAHRHRRIFVTHLKHTEESIKRGFSILRNDIEAELSLIRQVHLTGDLSGEQKVREEQLRKDLKNIEDLVGKEVWQLETHV